MKVLVDPLASPVAPVQVTSCPLAPQAASEDAAWNVSPLGSVSVTVNPPVLVNGPLFVTASV